MKQELYKNFLSGNLTFSELSNLIDNKIDSYENDLLKVEDLLKVKGLFLKIENEKNKFKALRNNINIVSLGSNCLPRTMLTKYGVKNNKANGEKSMPFDLSITSHNAVSKTIEDNFAKYFDNLSIGKNGLPINYYGQVFNHEKQKKFIENDFQLLIERYKNRINNFLDVAYDNNTYFVVFTENIKTLHNLMITLIKKRMSNKLIILNHGPRDDLIQERYFGLHIHVINTQTPENYAWFDVNHSLTEKGFNYEMSIISKLSFDCKNKTPSEIYNLNSMKNIFLKGYLSNNDADLFRELAIKNESNDIRQAHDLMTLAHIARPNGPFIKKKLDQYKDKLNIK